MFDKALFSKNMHRRRESLGFTLKELAAQINVSRRSLGAWESQHSPAMPQNFDNLVAWCEALGVTVGEALSNKFLPDEEMPYNSEHRILMRSNYHRYLTEEAYAKLTHRLALLDRKAVAAALTFVDSLQGPNPEAERLDALWEELAPPTK